MTLSFASAGDAAVRGWEQERSGPSLLERLGLRRSSDAPGELFPSLGTDALPTAETEHASFQLIDRLRFVNALVAIFAGYTPEALRMKAQIEEAGGTVMLVSQFDLPEAWLHAYAARLTCCIIGHDFDDVATAAEFCLRLRMIAPDLPIVLTMPGTAPHDFSPAMRPICDVRLRRPVSRVPLLLGIQAACDNRSLRRNDACAPAPCAAPNARAPVELRAGAARTWL